METCTHKRVVTASPRDRRGRPAAPRLFRNGVEPEPTFHVLLWPSRQHGQTVELEQASRCTLTGWRLLRMEQGPHKRVATAGASPRVRQASPTEPRPSREEVEQEPVLPGLVRLWPRRQQGFATIGWRPALRAGRRLHRGKGGGREPAYQIKRGLRGHCRKPGGMRGGLHVLPRGPACRVTQRDGHRRLG